MIKYCKIIDEEKGLVQLGAGCPDEYYKEIGMKQRDVQQSDIDFQWYLSELCPMKTPEQKEQEEKERIAALSMTRSDFFDGMIMAFGLDSKELRVVIENILNGINITPVEIKVALNNYDNALNFYRKHTLFTLLNNVPIDIGEYTLIFTSDIWDKFFDTKDYTELQKAIQKETL